MDKKIRISLRSRVIGHFKGIPAELIERRKTRNPIEFLRVGKHKVYDTYLYNGETIENAERMGNEMEVWHPTTHDMMPYVLLMRMTEDKLKGKIPETVNAYHITKFESIRQPHMGITTYQPLRVPEEVLLAA